MSWLYDANIRKSIPMYDDFHRQTVDLINSLDFSPVRWLDTGCGTGTFVAGVCRNFPETRFILADPSPSMLAVASGKLGADARIKFLNPVATQDLDLPDDELDVITAIQCHHYLNAAARRRAVANCYRMLRPGGIYVTFENIRPYSELGVKIGLRRWGNFQRQAGKSADEAEQHLGRFDHEYFPITVSQHLDLLRTAGFETVELLWASYMQAGFYALKS
jgi:tRNA (cmo5U34)-methyltransferase